MSFSYYNTGIADLIPDKPAGVIQLGNHIVECHDCGFGINCTHDGNETYFRLTLEGRKDNSYGDFITSLTFGSKGSIDIIYFYGSNGKIKGLVGPVELPRVVNNSSITYNMHFKKVDNGISYEIKSSVVNISGIIEGATVLPSINIGYGMRFSKLFISSEEILPYIETNEIAVNTIDNWNKNVNGEYVLTDVNVPGTVRINQESLSKLVKDYDIIGCTLVANISKKGNNLKSLKFDVDGTNTSKDIPIGESVMLIPLSFKDPSKMEKLTLTIEGE